MLSQADRIHINLLILFFLLFYPYKHKNTVFTVCILIVSCSESMIIYPNKVKDG